MKKSIQILLFMILATFVKIGHANNFPTGIYCHRGGNGKFFVDLNRDTIEVNNLFRNWKKKRLEDSEDQIDQKLLSLEGSLMSFTSYYPKNGYLNIRAHDYRTKTFINLNIERYDDLILEEKNKVNADITIYSFDIDPQDLLEAYKSSLRCELGSN